MKNKNKFIAFILLLLAASIVLAFAFIPSSQKAEVGKFYVTKQYANSFEVEEKPFYDTIQVLEVKGSSIKYVGWIGWEFVEHEKQFFTNFEVCKSCENKSNLVVKVAYEDRRR